MCVISAQITFAHSMPSALRAGNPLPMQMWVILKPVVARAVLTSLKHHACSPFQGASLPVINVLARTSLLSLSQQLPETVQTPPQKLSDLPLFSAQLVGLCCKDKLSARYAVL